MNENYEDIINLPHHVSKTHTPMSMWNRAAQFAPFAALNGHNSALMETEKQNEQMYEHQDDSSTFTEFQYENGEDFL
jgi:hypothetical protein